MKLCQLAFGQSFSVTCNAETGLNPRSTRVITRTEDLVEDVRRQHVPGHELDYLLLLHGCAPDVTNARGLPFALRTHVAPTVWYATLRAR